MKYLWRDLNPQARRHVVLNHTCIPFHHKGKMQGRDALAGARSLLGACFQTVTQSRVEMIGFEPTTSCMQNRRSTVGATGPCGWVFAVPPALFVTGNRETGTYFYEHLGRIELP